MVSRQVLWRQQGPVREEGSWAPLPGPFGDENSLAQPLGWPLPLLCHPAGARGLCLEPASLALGWDRSFLTAGPGRPGRFLRAHRACWMSPTSLPPTHPPSESTGRIDPFIPYVPAAFAACKTFPWSVSSRTLHGAALPGGTPRLREDSCLIGGYGLARSAVTTGTHDWPSPALPACVYVCVCICVCWVA